MQITDKIREELANLLCREVTGQLSEPGRERLQQLRAEYGLKGTDFSRVRKRLRQGKEFDDTEAWKKFKRKTVVKKQFILRWCAGVAAVMLLLIGISLLVKDREGEPQQSPLLTQQAIRPGKSMAVITLADGQQVELGSKNQELKEKNGILLNLDSTSVRYQKNERATKELIYNTIAIPAGGEYHLILSDGSKVWINADSKLKFPVDFTGNEREVYLEGEAYFEVSKDQQHPFIVRTSRGTVKVLGTGFNVRDYSDEAKVVTTLVNGSVAYRSRKYPSKTVVLQPGFQVEDKEGGDLRPEKVDVMMYVGWKDGKYIFENTTLEEIMQVLSKWYNVAVFYRNEKVKNLHFTGDLERYDDINDFLEFMEIGGNVHFSIQGKTIMVE